MKNISSEVKALEAYLILKNYSIATCKAYCGALRQFLHWRLKNGYQSAALSQDQAREYILWRYKQGKKWQTINGDYSTLMKYFRQVKKMEWDVDHIPRPRKEKQLPRILSKETIEKIIAHAPNLKHQTFMCLLYGTGIRLSEAINLKITDIDGERKQLLIAKGKGAKDRYVDIPLPLLELLRHYYKMYRPLIFLFNGKERGKRIAPRSCQHLIKVAAKRAKIQKSVSPHIFRHCYATHHLESGSNLLYLQKQLGHKQLKTTVRYVHLIKDYSWHIVHPIAKIQIQPQRRIV